MYWESGETVSAVLPVELRATKYSTQQVEVRTNKNKVGINDHALSYATAIKISPNARHCCSEQNSTRRMISSHYIKTTRH